MEKRMMKKLGIQPSLLGFGCMRFPTLENGKIDEVTAEKMIDAAMAAGVTYYDTAYPYHGGESEVFTGRVLNKYGRSEYFLATKLPVWLVDKRERVRELFEEQLKKLDKTYVDFYLVHAMNKERLERVKQYEVIKELEGLRKEGKIRYLGFSFHDSYEVFEDILNYYDWDFCQIQYNYMDTHEQAGDRGYRLAAERGIPLIVMEPVRGGLLADFSEDISGIFRSHDPQSSIASWALRWVASHPGVNVVLSGMSSEQQTEDNLKTFSDFRPLTKEEDEVVEKAVEALRARVQNGCTGCGYCMPCPAGVNIPANFRLWNTRHIYAGATGEAQIRLRWKDMPDQEKSGNCIKCGKCETKCPQKIRIRKDLETVQKEFEGE